MGLEYQICYNGGAQGGKCNQYRFPYRHYVPPPPTAGGNLKIQFLKTIFFNFYFFKVTLSVRDWSLITGRGGYKMGKSRV